MLVLALSAGFFVFSVFFAYLPVLFCFSCVLVVLFTVVLFACLPGHGLPGQEKQDGLLDAVNLR